MATIREFFHLEQYTEEEVDKVVGLKTAFKTTHMTVEEISKETDVPIEDVKKILGNTFQVWGH